MSEINFKIVTPERVIYEDKIQQVSVTTESGEITILPRHIQMVSLIKPGELRIKKEDGMVVMAISGGFVEVRDKNEVVILADTAERDHEIDVEKAKEAHARAEKMLEEKESMDDIEYAKLQAVIDREMARVRVGNKYR